MPEYPVPQFIESEAKIIFFLTFRQFFILVGGGVLSFILYFILPFILFIICLMVIVLVVIIVAFFKVNNESAVKILLNFIGFSVGLKNYTWKKEGSHYMNQEVSNIKDRNLAYNEPSFKSQEYIKKSPGLKPENSKLKSIKKIIETKR